MEEMMKKICEGTRQRDEVVQTSLEMYREMYMKARQQSQVLKSVCNPGYFSAWGVSNWPSANMHRSQYGITRVCDVFVLQKATV